MDVVYHVPGTSDPDITIRRSALGGVTVLAGAVKLRSRSRLTPTYAVPMPDGSTRILRIAGQWTGLKAVVDGVETRLEAPIPAWAVALTILPLGLVIVGGLIGGLAGGAAAVANTWVVRRPWPTAARLVAMLVVPAVAAVAWLWIVFAITPLPKLAVGACMNGLNEGVVVTTSTTRQVDCGTPHDNEVVGVVDLDDSGSFPGDAAILTTAQGECARLFADYVGIAFDASVLEMLQLVPTELTWAKGDRQIACIVLTVDGSRLTGSVKGAGR
ncbi:MAG: septum formation family protein [Candidatus Limnocylindrales bacterium]